MRQLVYTMFITNKWASFHSLWKENLVKFRKILKYYENDYRFDTSNYKLDRPLPKGKKINKMIGLMKNELGGKIMTKFIGLRKKTYTYLIDDGCEVKKQKPQKSVSWKEQLYLKIIKTV